MFWPHASEVAVSEYSFDSLFPRAFPWLYPGGTGDFLDYRESEVTVAQYARTLLYYYDGRFARDKFWCFYTLNYCERRKNNSQGSFYVNTYSNDKEKTVQEIADEIKAGNTSWIDKISFFASSIKGSSNYWRTRRNEVNTWISHHVKKGNGPPTFFMTFSCAEYWWPDLQQLIIDRFTVCGLDPPDISELNKVRLINEYTIITQEYFQERMKNWLETVGKDVFGIEHYWLRFEFAPSRGQIHAHMLVICPKYKSVFREASKITSDDAKAEFLAEWCETHFGYTSKLYDNDRINQKVNTDCHPCATKFSDLQPEQFYEDLDDLRVTCHKHTCNGFCKSAVNRCPILQFLQFYTSTHTDLLSFSPC
jgi:Helitron helicase-like domain at N-terminus